MKDIKKALYPAYREDFLKGYTTGLDPHITFSRKGYSEAFHEGFDNGRREYEAMNGLVCAGIPERVVTRKTLDDFLLAGMLGLEIDSDGYTTFQLDVIEVWYRNGIDQYNPEQTIYLREILEQEGIEL
jgi:hypothetical protein